MNKDLFTGLFVSATLHFAIVNWGHKAPPPSHSPRPKDDPVTLIEMPPLDEEKTVKVEDLPEETPPQQLAPPRQIDVPAIVPVDAFTQPLSPPQPPGIVVANTVAIPVTNPREGNGWHTDIFKIEDLNQKPTARVQPQPAYPYEMSKQGISGEVVVEFIINENGDVIDSRVVRSSNREFAAPALQAVQKWKFKAGRKGGQAVKVRVSQLLEFNLEDLK